MLFKLIQNEWMKLFNRTSTYVMCGLLVVGVMATAVYTFYNQADQELPGKEQWQAELIQQNEEYSEQEATTNNYYIESNAINQQAINTYRLENDISPYETENVWGYMDTNMDLVQLIGVLVIIVGASIVSLEFKNGTIKLLLVRSASRTQILMAKFITTILFGLYLLTLLFVLSFAIGGLLFGFGGSATHISASHGDVYEWPRILYLGINYLTSSISLLMLAAFAFMVSTIFRSDAIAIAISVMLMFVGTTATNILALLTDWAKFSLFANTNLNAYFSGGPMVEGMTLQFSIIMLVVYLFVFLFLSFIFFKRRDVSI
ncbi:ABC transporter permease subunit [Lentibacillus salinarum]|uniref:ABC transporter permease subunit n=1 Tax=Lentibacillus salinarum TaxID=446820 RepID=A0ABW3ZSB1_9BACI